MLPQIKDVTPIYFGYDDYPKDEEGRIILPRKKMVVNGKERNVIVIHRKNTVNYGNNLIGLCDGTKIAPDEWVALRKCFLLVDDDGTEHFHWSIGGSDSGVTAFVSKFSDCKKLYQIKNSDEISDFDADTQFRFDYGHQNEELLARAFSYIAKATVVKDNTVFFNEEIGFVQANVDFFVQKGDGSYGILEIKTTNCDNYEVIRDYRNGIIPESYLSQAVRHYPLVLERALNITHVYFAIGYGNSIKNVICLECDRDIEGQNDLLEKEKVFYDYLANGIEPPDETTSPSKTLEAVISDNRICEEGKITKFSKAEINNVEAYKKLNAQIDELKMAVKELESQRDVYKAQIIKAIGDAEITESFDCGNEHLICSYKQQKRDSVDTESLRLKYPEVYKDVVKTSKFRVLRISKAKGAGKK